MFNKLKKIKTLRAFLRKTLLYLSGRTILDNALRIAADEGLKQAVVYLKKKYRVHKFNSIKFGIILYDYLAKLESESFVVDRNTLILHFCCWGKCYTDKAINYLLPSLNSPNNLQFISKFRKIIILIHCDQMAKNELVNSCVVKKLQLFVKMQFFVIPERLLDTYKFSYSYPLCSFFKRINGFKIYIFFLYKKYGYK